MAVIKTKFNLLEIEGEIVSGNTSVVVQPCLGEAPESLNAVEMSATTDILVPLMGNSLMLPSHLQCHISMEVIGIVYAPSFGMTFDKGQQRLPLTVWHWKSNHLASSLVDAEDNMLPMCTPSPFALTMAAEHRFIQLQFTRESKNVQLFHSGPIDGLTEGTEGLFYSGQADWYIPPHSVSWYSQYKKIEQMAHYIQRDTQLPHVGPGEISELVSTGFALDLAGVQRIEFAMATARTGSPTSPAELTEKGPAFCHACSELYGACHLHLLNLPWSHFFGYYLK